MLNKKLATAKIFWDRYEWRLQDDFSYRSLEDRPIRMKVTQDASLLLDTGDDFSYISLGFEEKGKEEVEIAWDDEGHPHPYVMRMDEWKLLSRRIAAQHKTDIWIPALLLMRFVGFSTRTELEAIVEQGSAMRRLSGLYTEEELQGLTTHELLQDLGYWSAMDRQWQFQEPYGWTLSGEDAYSLRGGGADNPGFPFDAWNRMIASVGTG